MLCVPCRGLCRESPDFAGWWQDQTVRERTHGRKRIRHPIGCELTVDYDALARLDNSDQCLQPVIVA